MNIDVIRAWKDEEYRLGLSEVELPENPAGLVELADADLEEVAGAAPCTWTCSWTCSWTSFAE